MARLTLHKIIHNPFLLVGSVLLAVLTIYMVVNPNISASLGSLTGFTVISLDQMDYKSTNPIFNEGAWNMVTRVDGSGQYAEGTFPPDLIYQKFGLLTADTFTITQNITEQSCEYQVTNITYKIPSWKTVSAYRSGVCCASPGCKVPAVGSICGCSKTGYTVMPGTVTSVSYGSYNSCGANVKCECPAYETAKIAGTVHLIDSSTTYFTKINTTLTVGDVVNSLEISSQELEKQIDGVMYVKLTGYLMGQRTCPVPAADYSVWRPFNTMNYQIKDKYILNQVVSACTNVNSVSNVYSCQSALAQIPTAQAAQFYNCDNATSDGFSTKIRCVPKYQAAIPETMIVVSANTIGVVVPVAIPEIVEVQVADEYKPSANNKLVAKIKNNADVSGAVDVSLLGGTDISTASKRVTIEAGQTQDVEIFFQGTGIIKTYSLEAVAVNDPSQKDTEEVRIKIVPFCDKNKPSAQHVAVYTQYGCEWICPNQYYDDTLEYGENQALHNIFEQDCGVIDLEELADPESTYEDDMLTKYSVQAKHCLEANKYEGIMSYMNDMETFIPEYKDHQVWLASPFCKYVAEYGYTLDSSGNAVEITDDYEFIVSTPASGQEVVEETTTIGEEEQETTGGVGETGGTTTGGTTTNGSQELVSMNTLLIIAGVGAVALIVLFRKKIMAVIK